MRFARDLTKVGVFMEQRLGKTLAIHRWMDSKLKVNQPKIILTNASVVHTWVDSLERDGHEPVLLLGPTAKKEKALADGLVARRHWFVSNHETVYSSIARFPWHGAVIDESTFIKNPRSKAFRFACKAFGQVPVRAIASGLPNPEDPAMDLVCQMLWLKGSCMGCTSFWQWRAKYATPVGYEWMVGAKAVAALKAEVERCCFVLTRKQAGVECIKDRSTRVVKLPLTVMNEIKRARSEFILGDRMVSNIFPVLGYEAKLAGGFTHGDDNLKKFAHEVKAKEVVRVLRSEFNDKPAVIWARHNEEVYGMAKVLQMIAPTTVVTGAFTPEERHSRVAKFNAGEFRFIVAQPRCLQKGVDLSRADVAIIISNYFDHEIRAQLEDRIVKIGKPSVTIIDIVAKDTIDERTAELLVDKKISSAVFFSKLLDSMKRGGA